MKRLINSEIWRDGGSLSAIISDGQRVTSFWLQTNMWDKPSEKQHLELFVSHGGQPELKEAFVARGSPEERNWITFLCEASLEDASDDAKERFSELLQILRDRQDQQAEPSS
jgi:hypothetical protein